MLRDVPPISDVIDGQGWNIYVWIKWVVTSEVAVGCIWNEGMITEHLEIKFVALSNTWVHFGTREAFLLLSISWRCHESWNCAMVISHVSNFRAHRHQKSHQKPKRRIYASLTMSKRSLTFDQPSILMLI